VDDGPLTVKNQKGGEMAFKFESLEVWGLAVDYVDAVYRAAESLPKNEEYNLRSQWIRAATSIALNIAEGSTGQSDSEQTRFLGYALRSLIETVACLRLVTKRGYPIETGLTSKVEDQAVLLSKKIHVFRRALTNLTQERKVFARG
jgi:four helix bundle protein